MRVEYFRNGLSEEFHEGLFVRFSEPCEAVPYYLRSCAKPLQASLLIDYGADLTEKELAFCSGSHTGEDCHIETARGILKKFDLDESLLKCGIHPPLSKSMRNKMLLRGEKERAVHNNCSGKHVGFLVMCRLKGWDTETYCMPEHPLQIEIKNKIYDMCALSARDTQTFPVSIDGCGAPIWSMPLHNMLIGYKNLLKYDKLINAVMDYPYIYGGENRIETEIIENTDGLIAKAGAGGLCTVFNTKIQDGFAVKIYDCSTEARRIAVLEMINRLGWGNIDYDRTIKTLHGQTIGEIVVSS